MKLLLAFLLASVALTSCGKHSDGTSVWADFVWVIPTIMFIGAGIFLYQAYRSSKSNSTTMTPGKITDNTGNVSMFKHGYFKFAAVLIIAAIAVIIFVNMDK